MYLCSHNMKTDMLDLDEKVQKRKYVLFYVFLCIPLLIFFLFSL